jgi:hypothetical protein
MARNLRELNKLSFRHISDVAATNSRVFYASGSRIYFTKVIEGDIDHGRCFQTNDPTHDEFSDLLATDGGFISIKGAGKIKAVVPFRNGILAASDEGCWYLTGAEFFAANDINITKVTDFGIEFPRSIVVAGQNAFYLNQGGIVAIVTNEFETIQGNLITDQTIRSYIIEDLTADSGQSDLKSTYDPRVNEIHWISSNNDKALIFDLNTQGFYPQKFELAANDFGPQIVKIFDVINSTEIGGDYIYASNRYDMGTNPQSGRVTLSTLTNEEFADNDGITDTEYEAYLVAGPESLGQFALKKTVTSIALAFNRTEENIIGFDDGTGLVYDKPSGCLLSAEWDTSTYEGYKSQPRQVYLLNRRRWIPNDINYPFPITEQGDNIVYYTDKIRGNRRLVSFKFEAEKGKDMQLLGFSVDFAMKGKQR